MTLLCLELYDLVANCVNVMLSLKAALTEYDGDVVEVEPDGVVLLQLTRYDDAGREQQPEAHCGQPTVYHLRYARLYPIEVEFDQSKC